VLYPLPKALIAAAPGLDLHEGELALRFRCRRWSCRSCSWAKRQEWIERLHEAMAQGRIERLYHFMAPSSSWARIRKALSRAEARFLRVSLGIERSRIFILATTPLLGWKDVTPGEALKLVAEALRQVRSTSGEPVTASEGWLPPVQRDRRYIRKGAIPASDQHLEDTIRAERTRGNLRYGKVLEPGSAAAWTFSPALSPEERNRVRDRIFGHTLTTEPT
jgi:uncharacterized protein YoaH (UPF0181 family)